jgi:hypothetical protein
MLRELEGPLKGLYPEWLGQDLADVMKKAGEFFLSIGGFPLPNLPAIREPFMSK